MYYKTTIVNNLALAVIIIYDPGVLIYDDKVGYKLKHTFQL